MKKAKRQSTDPRVTKRSRRGGRVTANLASNFAKHSKRLQVQFEQLAKQLDKLDANDIWVDGQTKPQRAFDLLEEFIINAGNSIQRQEIKERGK